MSGTYKHSQPSKRSLRRNRKKEPFQPPSNGKPTRLRSAGTRVYVK